MTTPEEAHPMPARRTVALAYTVAIIADAVQVPLGMGMLAGITIPFAEAANIAVDIVAMLLTVRLLGFHWVLLPGFLLEGVPLLNVMPTWTGCVAYLLWKRKREAAALVNQPIEVEAELLNGGESHHHSKPPGLPLPPAESVSTPRKLLPTAALALFCVALVALFAFSLRHTPKHARIESEASRSSETTQEQPQPGVAHARPKHSKPFVVVAAVDIQSAPYSPLSFDGKNSSPLSKKERNARNAERIRSALEDRLGRIGGLAVLEGKPGDKQDEASSSGDADFILRASLIDLQDKWGRFRGYGVDVKSLQTDCAIRLKLIGNSTHSIAFTKTLTGSKSETATAVASASPNTDRDLEAIDAALAALDSDKEFNAVIDAAKTQFSTSKP